MIIWSGFGILIAIVGFGCLVFTELVTRAAFDERYYQAHGWPKLVGFWLAAAVVYFLSLGLNRQPARVLIDKSTGQEVVLEKRHSLFFIPVRFWPYIFLALGVLFLFSKE